MAQSRAPITMVTRAQGPARLRSGGVAKVAKTILKRILQTIPVLFVVVTITFVLTRMIPGDPAAQMLGPQASPDAIATMRVKMGLDEPMLTQYINYLVGILHGNFGYSYSYSGPVMPIILSRLPSTLSITLTGPRARASRRRAHWRRVRREAEHHL